MLTATRVCVRTTSRALAPVRLSSPGHRGRMLLFLANASTLRLTSQGYCAKKVAGRLAGAATGQTAPLGKGGHAFITPRGF